MKFLSGRVAAILTCPIRAEHEPTTRAPGFGKTRTHHWLNAKFMAVGPNRPIRLITRPPPPNSSI